MMKKGRKIILLLFIVGMSMFFIGCKKIDVRSETIINENESGRINLFVKYDDMLEDYIKGDIFNKDWADINGYTVNKHLECNNKVEELSYEFNNLKDLENKMNSSGLINLSHTDEVKDNKKIYNFNLVVKKLNIEELLKKSIHTGDKAKDKYVLHCIENLVIHNDIKYHNAKVKHNPATESNSINIGHCKLSQLHDNTNIRFCVQ